MNLLHRLKFPVALGVFCIVGLISSCEQELTTIGEGVIGGEPFVANKQTFDVFAFNKKIEAVQTNQLPIYQLGVFNDLVYGKTTARITSQVQLASANPSFGDKSAAEEIEDSHDEKERIDSLFIYIPYITNDDDTDNDGVVDSLDDLPDDPTNDSDNDGVPNNEEVAANTDPLNPDNETTLGNRFAKRFRIDSIYGDRTQPFTFKLERSDFFLRDLDPNTNFQESQEYFSSEDFTPFNKEVFFDSEVTISDEEILFLVKEDDPDTEENEIGTVSSRLTPGIYVKLNDAAMAYFQQNILNKEGSTELLSDANFKNFFRGVHMSLTPSGQNELLMLLDITDAKIDMYYSYDQKNEDGSIEVEQKAYEFRLITQASNAPIEGNAVNTFVNDAYPPVIADNLDNGENASKIYLKGGAGSYAEVKLFDENQEAAEILINQIRANNWVINEANLVFYVDQETLPVSAIEPPRLYLFNAETNTPLYNINTENSIENTALGVYLNYDGILEESDNRGLKYTVKITEYINDIIVRNSTNATLGLAITPDIRIIGANTHMLANGAEKDLPVSAVLSPLGTVLFGSNLPDENENKLKLEIFYTETN